jgi:hypothetical protein
MWVVHAGNEKGDRISKVLQEMKCWDRNQCGTERNGQVRMKQRVGKGRRQSDCLGQKTALKGICLVALNRTIMP